MIGKPLKRSSKFPAYTAEQVESCTGKIRGRHRNILLAAITDEYTVIAEKFDLPLGTVKSRINRARTALARALASMDSARS